MIFSDVANKTGAEVVKELETSLETGLFSLEIKKRQAQYGPNALKSSSNKWWHMLLRQFSSSFVYYHEQNTPRLFKPGDECESTWR
ncbi:hypothetical protein IPF37_02795 [bacterium]|nr:MAG: hypothetical protein IPF37_02795 [bacterium]